MYPEDIPGHVAQVKKTKRDRAQRYNQDGAVSLEEDEDLLVQFEDIWSVRDAATDGGSVGGRSGP